MIVLTPNIRIGFETPKGSTWAHGNDLGQGTFFPLWPNCESPTAGYCKKKGGQGTLGTSRAPPSLTRGNQFCVHHWISDFQFQSHKSSYKMTEQTCSQMPRSFHSFLPASSSLSLYSPHSARGSCTPSDPTGLSQHMREGTRREALQHTPWRWQYNSDGPEDRQDAAAEAGGQ